MRPDQTVAPQATPELPPRATLGGLMAPFEMTLPAVGDAPAAARAAITVWMARHVGATMLADAQLLVSELVANSVRHADAPADALISVRADVRADVLRLEVSDRGTGGSVARRAPDLLYGGGFGLNVVEVLALRWGVHRDAGTRVWLELAFPALAEPREEEPVMHLDNNERTDKRRDAVDAARRRAHNARDRALAAREAAEQATTEYARRAHHRVADLHTELAVSHEDFARTLRVREGPPQLL